MMPRAVRPRRGSAGFTLLEAIVTLVIASLIVVVLMQALQQSLGLRTRLLRHDRESRMAGLQEQWFRDTVSSALHDLPDALGPFNGDGTGFEFVSAAPLAGQGIARVRWRLEPVDGGSALAYRDPRWEQLVIVPGPLREAAFEYLDAEGNWVREWTPPDPADPTGAAAGGLAPLPRMVRLRATTSTGELSWLVSIPAEPRSPTMLRPEDTNARF